LALNKNIDVLNFH